MKKLLFSLLMSVMAVAVFATTIEVNSSVTEDIQITAAGDYILQGDGSTCTFPVVIAENLGAVTINTQNVKVVPAANTHAMLIGSGTDVTLLVNGTNHYEGHENGCGIQTIGNLTIVSATNSEADSLYTKGGKAPAIGVISSNVQGGNLTINGAKVVAYGTFRSAAIGNGYNGSNTGAKMGQITINGGYVYADATTERYDKWAYGAGLGSGHYDNSNKNKTAFLNYAGITINGGVVIAKSYGSACGIGCCKYLNGGNIVINGGTITAGSIKTDGNNDYPGIGGQSSSKFTGSVIINGGNINATVAYAEGTLNAVNNAGQTLQQVQTSTTPNALITFGAITGTDYSVVLGTDYGINGMYALADGSVYMYVPAPVPTDAEILVNMLKLNPEADMAINAAGNYLIPAGVSTHALAVAENLGEVTLMGDDVTLAGLSIGAGSTVVVNGNNFNVEGNITGAGTLHLVNGMHVFKGAQPTVNVVVEGGNIQTLDATGAPLAWTGVKNAAGADLTLIVGEFTADGVIINGQVSGTDYFFDLKDNYNLTNVRANAEGKVFIYAPAPMPADAVAEFNLLIEIDLVANGSAEVLIEAAGKYQLNGNRTRTTGKVTVAENVGEVLLILNGVDIKAAYGIKVCAGNDVTIQLQDSNSVKAGTTYNTGIICEGNVTFEGPGKLYAEGSTGAGIGCQHQSSTPIGNITINGGWIYAKGSTYGAGIGMAYVGKNTNNAIITINGGTIIAKAGTSERAIGKADTGDNLPVHINGGNVKCLNNSGAIVTSLSRLTNDADEALVLYTGQTEEAVADVRVYGGSVGEIVLGEGYGMNDVYTVDTGMVYIWVPQQAEDAVVVLDTTEPVEPEPEMEYTIVGVEPLLGASWDVNAEANLMEKGEDGIYRLEKENVTLSVGEYAYKVVGNHDYEIFQLPLSGNQMLNITIKGIYNVLFTLDANAEPKVLTATATLIEEIVEPDPELEYTIVGVAALMGAEWDVNAEVNLMTKAEEGIYRLEKTDVTLEVGNYEYKVVGNHNYDVFQLPASGNQTLVIAAKGIYTIVFTLDITGETKVLTAVATLIQEIVDPDPDPDPDPELEYTIVGVAALMGAEWDVNAEANLMTKVEEGIYRLEKTDVTLEVGNYEYKVVGNHNYDVFQLPANGNQSLAIATKGIYTIVFTLDITGETKTLAAEATLTQEIVDGLENQTVKTAVYGNMQSIVVNAVAGETVTVYSVTGATIVSRVMGNETIVMPMSAGCYLVRVAGETYKVIVK